MSGSLCDPKKKSMTSLVIWHGLLLLYVLTWTGSAFNLDAKYPKVITYTQNSYFGYSLAFWNGSNGYKVLVGSPKAKFGDLVTGGLFQCDIKTSDCQLINVEEDSRPDYSRSNQWLGVALDVSPINQSLVIVCAHRAKFNVTYGNISQNMLSGICYQLINLKMQKSVKLSPDQNLLGIFVQYAKKTRILLIGTPGVRNYRGGYIQRINTFELYPLSSARYAYSGYCVAVLNNKSAIGMPRYKQYGAVYYENEIIRVESKYSYGSYFGSALAAVDLNSDGKEDLLVGAPYYSEHILEEGRVYIFFFSYSKLKDVPNMILSVPSNRGQFGKAIATGDFNNDGYSDVIVAAPYENDGSGTIYIFSGHRFGLHETFSQKIQGKDLRATNVKSFGISFSRATDIDNNGYPDIAVGAYLSDKVFVFYGRPIVQLNGSLEANPKNLLSCSDCWQGKKHIFTMLKVEMDLKERSPMTFYIHLNMDANRKFSDKRTFLENDQKEFKETVEIKQFFRKEFRVIIKNTVDILEPINFTFTYHLKDEGYSPNCSSTCPIAKNGSFSTQVKFDIGCGFDETCMTSLKVTLNKNSRKLILGRDQKFVLLAKVENLGENAYAAKARIFFSSFLEFESVNQTSDSNVECHQESNQELSCFLGHPLKEKSSVNFEVIFFISGMPKESSIHVIMNATTISHVADEYLNNTQTLWANLYFESTFEATGVSIPETDVFKGGSTSKRMTVRHLYELRNNGPTDAFSVRFFVLIPQAIFQDIPLLIFRRVKMSTEDGKVFNNSCHLKPYTETKEDFKATMQHLRHNGYVFNCSGFKCHNISCELDKLEKNGPVIHVQIYFEIHIKLLELFQGRIRRINIVTTSNLTQEPSYRLKHLHLAHAEAKTTIIINRLPAKLKWWVVICSIAVGLLILLIFSILLWHCGYFKRMRVNKRQIREERAKEERSLLEHDSGRRPSQKIYTRQKISESEEIPEIE